MTSYIDKYRKRMNQEGGSLGSAYTSRTHAYINRKFKENPQYRRAKVSSTEFPTINEIDIHITSIERMGGIKNIIFRPNETLGLGSYLTFDDGIWMIYDLFKNTVATKAIAQECNTFLKWQDEDGLLHKVPCYTGASDLGSKAKQSRSEIAWNKYDVRLPAGQLFCYVELNDATELIDIEQRLLFGDRAYKVVGYDATTLTNMEGFGVIYFTLALTTKQDDDDFVSGIANKRPETSSNVEVPEDEDDEGKLVSWG